jgi:hypothetical protein
LDKFEYNFKFLKLIGCENLLNLLLVIYFIKSEQVAIVFHTVISCVEVNNSVSCQVQVLGLFVYIKNIFL